MITQTLLAWLVLYAGLLAGFGFILYVGRSFSGRPLSNAALLRIASTAAFAAAVALFLLLALVD